MIHIYALAHPITRECRYIGKTSRGLKERLRRHIKDSARQPGARKSCSWVQSLRKEGLAPEIIEIEQCETDWQDAEKFWIEYFRFIGANLTNMRPGGCGDNTRSPSAEVRRKISLAAKKQFSSPEAREAASRFASQAWKCPDFAKQMRDKRAISNSSPEFRQKQREARIRAWQDPEYREKVVAGHAAADHSSGAKRMWERPEYREAQRLARERRYAKKEASR